MPGVFYPQARVILQLVFETFGDLANPKSFAVQPKSIQVNSNSYKEADTWSVEFDAKDMPFPPNLIRAGGIEIYLYQTRELGGDPVTQVKPEDPDTRNARIVAPDPVVAGTDQNQDGSIVPTIAGLIDNVELEYDEDGLTVSIDGRDYTSLFLDKEWPQTRQPSKSGRGKGKLIGKRIETGRRLDTTIQSLIEFVPGSRDGNGNQVINLKVEPTSLLQTMPIVGSDAGKTLRRGIPMPAKSSVWDAITTVAARSGFIVFVRGTDVVLTKPQNFIKGKTQVRKMAWGKNLERLTMRRKMGKERVPIIEIRSYDDQRRQTIVGRFPERGQAAAIGIGTERDQVRQFFACNIRSVSALKQIAETTYERLSRSEMIVQIDTKDLLDLEGNDIISLRTGDALAIKFDPFNNELLESMKELERFDFLVSRGYSDQVAAVVSENYRILDSFREPFRVREAVIDFSIDDGISINAELMQFVNVPLSDRESTA